MDYGDDQMTAWLRERPRNAEAHPEPLPEAVAWHEERMRRAAAGHRGEGVTPHDIAAAGIQEVASPVESGDAAQQAAVPPPQQGGQGPDFGAIASGALGYEGAIGQAQFMDASRRSVRSANPMYEPTKQYVGTARDVNEKRAGLDRQVYESKMAEAKAAADGADLMAETKMDIADREMARAARDQQRNLAVEENLNRYESQIGDAVRKLNETQDVDPSAGWENKSGWQKVRFALTSMFRGLAGRDPMDLVRFEVQKEVDAQKANQAKAIAGVDAAMGAYRTAGLGMRDTMLAASQDERTADAMTRVALYEGVAAKMEATAQNLGIDVASAEYQQQFNEMQKLLAEERLRLSQIEASNPRYFTKTVSMLGPEERRLRRKMGDEMVKSGGEAFKQGVGAERDQMKMRHTASREEKKDRFQQRKYLADKTESYRTELKLWEDFRKKYGGRDGDIPGVHALSRITPDFFTRQFADNRQARQELERGVMFRLRRESGAGTPDSEIEREARALVAAMDEDDVWSEIENREREARLRLDRITRAVDPEVEAEYLARPVGEREALGRGGGGGGLDSLALDE